MKDRIELRIIELQRELKACNSLIEDENQTHGTHQAAHVEKQCIQFTIKELLNLL